MKNIFILLCFLLPEALFAQTAKHDTARLIITDYVYRKGEDPLYVIDGKPVHGVPKINPDSIASIDVLKGDSATSIYGQRAINGVVIIHKKVSVKPVDLPKKDTLYVVDGVVVDSIKNINPGSIVCVDVLKEDELKSAIFCNPMKCVVIVVTDSGATKAYKKKFSAYSKSYKKYIEAYGENNKLTYVLNGTPLQSNSKETISKLYALDKKNIKRVLFRMTRDVHSGVSPMVKVIITTKNMAN